MSLSVCIEDGCPELVTTGRCETHRKKRDRARGTRQERGYDRAYDNERRHYEKRMARGERFTCWRCHKPIVGAWDLGHCVNDRRLIHGPQHVSCNRDTSSPACSHISHVT